MDPEHIIHIYQEAFARFGDADAAVLFPKGRQFVRFANLLPPRLPAAFSLLDLGCGLGKLVEYLDAHLGARTVDYLGVDIVPAFIDTCARKFPGRSFRHIRSHEELQGRWDVVLISGALSLNYFPDEASNQAYVYRVLRDLFERNAGHVLAVDFMHDQVDFRQPDAYHQNIPALLEFVENNLSRRFDLVRSSFPWEFTLRIYKDLDRDATGIYAQW